MQDASTRAPMRRRRLLQLIGTLPFAGWTAGARAETYPSKPIRLIISFAPGGPTDLIARTLAKELTPILGQQVIAENRPGAAGAIATSAVARADPDGYTLLFHEVAATFAIQPFVTKSLPYDITRDIAPVSLVARGPVFLLVNAELPVTNVKELIALAKAQPNGLSFGSAGGSGQLPTHIGPELLKIKSDIKVVHVPYKGAAPALLDLAAGRTAFMMTTGTGSAKPFLDSGKIRAIAVTGSKRSDALPNVPTFREQGVPLPELDQGTSWAVFGPRGIPADVVRTLEDAIAKALQSPELRKGFALLDIEPAAGSAVNLAAQIRQERETWPPLLKKMDIQPE